MALANRISKLLLDTEQFLLLFLVFSQYKGLTLDFAHSSPLAVHHIFWLWSKFLEYPPLTLERIIY